MTTRSGSCAATRAVLLLAVVAVLAGACGSSGPPATTAARGSTPGTSVDDGLVDIGQGLRGPSGLHASVVATGVPNVAALAHDCSGRLWVATADFEDKGEDAVYVVPKAGDRPTKVIADVHTPLGLLWLGDDLLVSSKERVTRYRGFDGTRFATATVVVSLPEGVGEVNGLVLGPDGRVRLGVSAPCDACEPELEQSAAVLSFRPDGTDLRVEASHLRAPIDLAYFPGTDDLFVTMNQQDGLGDATPGDWLAIVADGQNWRFPGCYGQGGDACAGVPAPVATLDRHAAVIGLAFVDGPLGGSVGTAAIVAEWAAGKVLRVALARDGSTYRSTVTPFVTGIEKPAPVERAPDGSLLIGDWATGTVYRIATG